MPVSRLGVVVHEGRPPAVEAAEAVRGWCAEHGIPCTAIDVWRGGRTRQGGSKEAAAAGHPDVIVTLGGDGTFLRGARIAAKDGARVLGVDLGRVGFLTEVPVDQVLAALDAVHEDRAGEEERMTLTLRTSRPLAVPEEVDALMLRYGRGPRLPPPERLPGEPGWGVAMDVNALNDVVLEKLSRDRQIAVAVYVAGHLLASYSADAAIVATPTGSTAYSFAAGGPVLSPGVQGLVFTPVAPHMSFNRSVVAARDEPVAARILPHSGQVAVSIDGEVRGVLDPGDWIGVYPSGRPVRLVRLGGTDFYQRLRERFRLADAPATEADGVAPPLFPAPTPEVPADMAELRLPPPAP
ncbi:NAD(+)/NADH kinase [Actinacidiphila guanduensis]|uniref:NAD kinase n=1 Tax=Actinacidiphila guanduensis TaxID=310781 RepID=A0A1H0MWQ5_9ACTN|nr:NAD(+)/NADH kinase [Actinacidiphila guanduensis]SDO84716.1 NAD+ kinase [Actinacidiphila guanduensis]